MASKMNKPATRQGRTGIKRLRLPSRLSGIQALTWLISRDVALTLDADPRRAININRAYNPPRKELFSHYASFDGTEPKRFSDKAYRAALGHPDEMGGTTLDNLILWARSKNTIDQAMSYLLTKLVSGEIKSSLYGADGGILDPSFWVGARLIEGEDPRVLVVVKEFADGPTLTTKTYGEPLFLRAGLEAARLHKRRPIPAKSAKDWMLSQASKHYRFHGAPIQKKAAVSLAQDEGYTVRAANSAYAELPEHLRNLTRQRQVVNL